MYYSSNGEEELGFDAFIAPDDFDRTAQPVDIYEVFKREYALSQRARYIYYYSDGNYPLTLTPTTDEYYRYGHRNGGVDVIYDVPLSSEGGVATTIWGGGVSVPNTSGGDESGFTHRWVVVYRVSTAGFRLQLNVFNAIWYCCGARVNSFQGFGNVTNPTAMHKYLHMTNLNSLTMTNDFNYKYGDFRGMINFPEASSGLGSMWGVDYWGVIVGIRLPNSKPVSVDLGEFSIFFGTNKASLKTTFHFGASTTLGRDEANRSAFFNLAILSVSQHNILYASFDYCDIIYTKDLTTIHWLAPKTVRGLYLPDELPQSQIDALGTKFSLQQLQNHRLYIGTQITDLTNLYLANKSFTTVEVGAGNTAFTVDGNILYNTTKTQLIKAGTSNTGDLIIPNTVTEILAGSFLRCNGYTGDLIIPNNVTSIVANSFAGLSGLTGNLTIPSSVTSIASEAFIRLTQLTSLTLPVGYDCAIYNSFSFADFSAASLNTAILNLTNGTVGTPKSFYISKTSLDALNVAYPNAVSDAALRFINVRSGIIQDGLKLWLDADNPASYPGTGTTWFDLSGNGNNGTMINGVVPLSNAMSFDGVDDYVATTNSFQYRDFVMGVKLSTTLATGIRGLFATGVFTDRSCRIINSILSNPGNGYDWVLSATNSYVNNVQTKNLTLGWNIVSVQRTNFSFFPTNFIMHLASGYNGRFFKGEIGFIVAYDRVLSVDEKTEIFNFYRSKYGI